MNLQVPFVRGSEVRALSIMCRVEYESSSMAKDPNQGPILGTLDQKDPTPEQRFYF